MGNLPSSIPTRNVLESGIVMKEWLVVLTVYLPHMYEILQIKFYNSKKAEKRYQRY